MDNLRMRIGLAIAGILLCLVWLVPNFMDKDNTKMWWPTHKKINYGLDIQGGLHLVMGVDIAGVVSESTARLANVLKAELATQVPGINAVPTKADNGELDISFHNGADKSKVNAYMEEHYPTTLQKVGETETSVSYRYFDNYMVEYRNRVIQQAIETIRNRIDEFGVAEPSISQQGSDRILVQLPGMADAEKAKALINTAAKLDFMLVEEHNPAEIQRWIAETEKAGGYSLTGMKYSDYVTRLNKDLTAAGKLPDKTAVLFEKPDNAQNLETGRIPYLVRTDTGLDGSALDDAFVSFDQYGKPEVSLRFNASGAGRFKTLTGQNIGHRLAVVLDKVIKTAPNLQTEIGNGQAVITLGGGRDRNKAMDEAKMIATSLRAGALPATLEQLEERRVGPSMGADAIHRAKLAGYLGALLVVIFMLARYRSMGIVSDVALLINILGVFALLSWLGATLTLPGIAGIALTVGFAVDANVLINERMREELRKGSSFLLAVKEGYARAMSAILDANITTAATAIVLLYFGTGPVRGFAVTLLIGIVTTLFANVFVSKVIVDFLTTRLGVKKLSV